MKLTYALLLLAATLNAAPETELKDASGKTIIRYVVEAPASPAPAATTDPAKQLGLILCFPEHDRPTGDEILPVREALERQGIRDQYVLLAGHPQERKFGAADHEPIEKLIAWARQTYPINPRRIYMYGKGEGGKISGEFAGLHPKLVTAGITYSWGWWTMPSEIKEPLDALGSAPEFYMVLGMRDLSYHITTVRDTYERVKDKGYHVIYREFDDLGARTYHPASNNDAIAWATALRNKNLPLSPEESKMIERARKSPAPVNGYLPDLALVGGPKAGEVVAQLLDHADANIRTAAAATCGHAVFSEQAIQALAKKTADPSDAVRRAAVHALAINANWRSAAAQQAIVTLAMDPSADAAMRTAAVDAIAHAVRYQVNGVRQDPPLFQALVTLLDDKNEELRVMAANILAPIRDPGFRGDLGRPEQKTPAGGWQQWLASITTHQAGFLADYEVCGKSPAEEAVKLFCQGGASLRERNPVQAFEFTLKAAEKGYVPAENTVGMFYATGKGVEQNYAEAGRWWTKAAEADHLLAASSLAMLYRGGSGVKGDPALAAKWAKYVTDHSPNP